MNVKNSCELRAVSYQFYQSAMPHSSKLVAHSFCKKHIFAAL
jgi:hypothetical protein